VQIELLDRVHRWIAADPDPQTAAALQALVAAGDHAALAALFAGRLAFGTAGLRAALGPGPMRMNRLVVRQTTAGLAHYLAASVPDATERGVFVGFDARNGSREFAEDAAGVLLAMGFRVFLAERLTATPVVAWGVVRYGACGGVMVTASHNPPEDNGYKVYWGNGAQIIPPHDAGIAAAIDAASEAGIECLAVGDSELRRLYRVANTIEAEYLAAVIAQRAADTSPPVNPSIRIAYSAMHGVGAHLALPLLASASYTNVSVVAEQNEPDGSFPTVRFPNPEEKGAIDRLLALAAAGDATIAIANDPDADRLAVAIPTAEGWYTLTGDETGALLADDLLSMSTAPHCVGTTVVSSRMLDAIAESHGATCFRTLTGFKWIANRAIAETAGNNRFVFGYEEAIGFSVGNLVRDKDGVSAALAVADLAARLAARGETLGGRLEKLRRQHGYYATAQVSVRVEDGGKALSARLRAAPVSSVGGAAVSLYVDLASGNREHLPEPWAQLPNTNAMFWFLENGGRIIVRPSGTEPKVKIYLEVVVQWADSEQAGDVATKAKRELDQLQRAFTAIALP
jgi:phosphomannomutase